MTDPAHRFYSPGPFTADQVREGDPYEISHGHPVLCMPSGGRHGTSNLVGGSSLLFDPAVEQAGVDVGYAPSPQQLRAPDVAVGNVPNQPGWAAGAPPLAVEYADTGQDEAELQEKIADLLQAGTRYIWVVRLGGPRRIEVYESGKPMQVVTPGQKLTAPGVLQNPVPVEAMYDRDAAAAVTLRNLLQRAGYQDLDDVRHEGREEGERAGREEGERAGRAHAIVAILQTRNVTVTEVQQTHILACRDGDQLDTWLRQAITAVSADDLF